MKLAATDPKAKSLDPTIISTEPSVGNGDDQWHKGFGLKKEIGSLEVGKKADLVVLDMRKLHLQLWFSLVSAVVYSITRRDVEMVLVDGKEAVKGGKLTTINEEEVWKEAEKQSKEIVERAGLTHKVKPRWPLQYHLCRSRKQRFISYMIDIRPSFGFLQPSARRSVDVHPCVKHSVSSNQRAPDCMPAN
jgi:hypothetical protein